MEIQSFINSPVYQETATKFRNKAKENTRQAFDEFVAENRNENNEQPNNAASDVPENIIADNGVKSTLLLGRLDSQKTEQNQSSGSMSTVKLTAEEAQAWNNGKRPEGLRFTGAGGVIFSGGTKAYHDYFNVYYTAGAEYDYQFGAFYDENSPEDNPIVYLRKSASTTDSLHYEDFVRNDEIIKVEINKVDPANATYEEMIALAGYIYRDDELAASRASEAIDTAREAMQADGLDWQNGPHDYTGYYLPEVVRRYKEYDPELSESADLLLGYLKDYPRVASTASVQSTTGLPDGLKFTNAWGMTVTAHTSPIMTSNGLVYETIEDTRHEYITYYDTNSPEDAPVMYVVDQDKMSGKNEYRRIEVNKINPLNASYEEMIALVGYTFRDDPQNAFEASEALVHARDYMEMEGLSPDGSIDYAKWLQEVVRRNIDYPNPSNRKMAEAAQSLLEYLKDYPRGNEA